MNLHLKKKEKILHIINFTMSHEMRKDGRCTCWSWSEIKGFLYNYGYGSPI